MLNSRCILSDTARVFAVAAAVMLVAPQPAVAKPTPPSSKKSKSNFATERAIELFSRIRSLF